MRADADGRLFQLSMSCVFGVLWLSLLLLGACNQDSAGPARAKIRNEHAPRVAEVLLEDLARHRKGIQRGADRISAGFVKVTGAEQERDMRQVLRIVRSPKRGIEELVISPMSFLAVVDKNGIVIARDAEPDKMKGMDLAKLFPSVRKALAGEAAEELGQFESLEKGGEPSVTIVMAAPAHYQNEVVGALVLGIPLWRLQQRLTKQLQMEESGKKAGVVIWAYIYKGDKVHSHGTPSDLDLMVPDKKARDAGYAMSPGGFTGSVQQYGYWYGYGVRPLRVLGPDVGTIIFRMDPE